MILLDYVNYKSHTSKLIQGKISTLIEKLSLDKVIKQTSKAKAIKRLKEALKYLVSRGMIPMSILERDFKDFNIILEIDCKSI